MYIFWSLSEKITVRGSIDNIEIPNPHNLIPIDGRFDEKKFKCSALNHNGKVVYEKEASSALDVAYGPRINCSAQTVNKITGDFEMACYIAKNPHPVAGDITLKRPNGELLVNGVGGISWTTVDVRVSTEYPVYH